MDQVKLWRELGGTWADKYWELEHTRGKQLVEFFKDLSVSTFLEIGCNSGRNLWYLDKYLPGKALSGLEISSLAAQDARVNVPTATIYEGNLHEFVFKNTYDVVFTGGVLMHMAPNLLLSVIQKCINLSNKYVIHMEPIGNGEVLCGPKEFNPRKIKNKLKCLHNIEKAYAELGYKTSNKPNFMGGREAFIVLEK